MNTTVNGKQKKTPEQEEREEILCGLARTREALAEARAAFNMAVEPELVEACVYKINALHAQYAFYLRLAKEKNMTQSLGDAYAVERAGAAGAD